LAQRARVGWARELSKGQQRAAFPAGGIASGRQVAGGSDSDSERQTAWHAASTTALQVSKSWAVSHSHSYRQSGVLGRRRIRTCGTAPSKPSSQSRTSSRAAGAMAVAANQGARPRRTIPKSDDPVSRGYQPLAAPVQPRCSTQCTESQRPGPPVPQCCCCCCCCVFPLNTTTSSSPPPPRYRSLAQSLSLSLVACRLLAFASPPSPLLPRPRPRPRPRSPASPHLTPSAPVATLGRVALHCTLHAALCM
jgi:hypothetical protein